MSVTTLTTSANNKQYKAVAFDMDGTLLNSQKAILPETVAVINQLSAKGIKVILVTGRHHSVIYPYYHQLALNTPVICCNGTYLYDFQKQHYFDANSLSKDQAKHLLQLVNKHQIHTLVYTDNAVTYEVLDDHLEGMLQWIASLPAALQPKLTKVDSFIPVIEQAKEVFKFATSSHDIPHLQAFSQEVSALGEFECEWSWYNRADVALKGNSKGNGLTKWAAYEQIELADIVAFGDSYNDLSMLKIAGLGIAMGNADDEIKDSADRVIGHHNEASIANTLKELFSL